DVRPGHQPAVLHPWQQLLLGGARISGAFQGHHLTGTQVGPERLSGIDHEAHVRLPVPVQRRRHTENQRIALTGATEIRGRLEAAAGRLGNLPGGDMLDIALPRIQPGNLALVDINPQYPKADRDRKSTRLNSSHVKISYAVF